ncbi:MAG: MmcQ/YjbR family DNA-binding protein [Hyphomonas sp.]|nr:MmcQ/YjbR family DNA-binding protein [Hyphomonas sp.]
MKLRAFNAYCKSLPHTTHVRQWGDAEVWKIGGKVFAIGREEDGEIVCSFKVSELSFDILKEQPGCRGAPHLASRGMKWIQRYSAETLGDDDVKAYLEASYRLVAAGLTKKLQRELGFLE